MIADMKRKHGERLQWVEMDVTQDASVQKAVKDVLAKAGTIDALICNAGMGVFGSIEEMPMNLAIQQFETNVFGYLRTLKAVLPVMREKKAGKIVLTGSLAGIMAIPFQAHYSATKYAIEAFTEGLRQEMRPFGIQVAAVRPGDINTDFNNQTLIQIPENSPYAKWSKKCWETIDKNLKVAPAPKLVAKTVYKILKKKHPKAYYTASDFLSGLAPKLMPFMPAAMKEGVVRMFYNL